MLANGTTSVAHRSTHRTALAPACQTQLHTLAPRNTARRTIQPTPRSLVRRTACERGRTRHWMVDGTVCMSVSSPSWYIAFSTMQQFNHQRSSLLSSPTGERQDRRAAAAQQALRLACACTARGRGGGLPAAAKVWQCRLVVASITNSRPTSRRGSAGPACALPLPKRACPCCSPRHSLSNPGLHAGLQRAQAFSSSTPCSAPSATGALRSVVSPDWWPATC